MATAQELIQSTIDSAKAVADGKVSRFRENEDSADFHSLSEYASFLNAMSNRKVQDLLEGNTAPRHSGPIFTSLC